MINIKMIARGANGTRNALTQTYTRDEVEQLIRQVEENTLNVVEARIAATATTTLDEVDARIATASANTATAQQMDAAESAIATIREDEITTLSPTVMLSRIMLRNNYNGSEKYDIIDYGSNYNTYVYNVAEGDVLDVVVTGTAGGSATFLAGAYYDNATTLDHTTAVSYEWNNADVRKVVGHSRLTVPTGAQVLAISQYKNNTVTVKRLKLSRLGAVEDKLATIIIPYNAQIPPFYDGQLAHDSTTGNVYVGVNGSWVAMNATT